MAHIKAPKIAWQDEARRLQRALRDAPGPPGMLARYLPHSDLKPDQRVAIELVHDQIGLHLAYRLRVTHKINPKHKDGSTGIFVFNSRDPKHLRSAYDWLLSIGVPFSVEDLRAIDAQERLQCILIDGYVSPEWIQELPLLVASIGGQTLSEHAHASGRRVRRPDRRGPLARIIANERMRDPFATATVVLDRICNGDAAVREVVRGYKNGRLYYLDTHGNEKSIGLDRFETIFSEQKPSTG